MPRTVMGYVVRFTGVHQIGLAHSVEVWQGDELVGGLYGVSLGKVFYGESMFARVPNASKAGFIRLVRALEKAEFTLIDCQQDTEHLMRLGARNISRDLFLEHMTHNAYARTLMGLADGSIDGATCGFALRNLVDLEPFFVELARVVRPGGAIAFHLYGGATWSPRRDRRTDASTGAGLWQPRSTAALQATLEAAGLRDARIRAFRSIRVWPYLLEIPARLDRGLPVQLWSHAIVIARAGA